MEIFIDGEHLNFALEGEKTLADVYRALDGWLAGQGGRIAEFSVDGVLADPPAVEERLKAGIDTAVTVEIKTRSDREQSHHELTVILEYFSLLEKALIENSGEALPRILSEYPYLRPGLERHLKDLFPVRADPPSKIDEILTRFAKGEKAPAPEERGAVLEYVGALILIVKDRIQELAVPGKESAALARLILAAKPVLENVPVLLQTGKDREAMQSILGYTELALKATRLLSQRETVSPETNEFCRELNEVLKELAGAFQVQDSVLIGDILEYELAPRSDRLAELLRSFPEADAKS